MGAEVLLAGGRDWHPYIHVPLGMGKLHGACSTGDLSPSPNPISAAAPSKPAAARCWASMTASNDNMCARNHSKKVLALHPKTGNPVPAPRRGGHHREFIVHSIEY